MSIALQSILAHVVVLYYFVFALSLCLPLALNPIIWLASVGLGVCINILALRFLNANELEHLKPC